MAQVDIQKQAYKKAILHSLKYANDEVIGALIGTVKESAKGNIYKVTDAFPLFHSRVLQCTLEIAFQLIEANLGKDQKIIGLYETKANKQTKTVSGLGNDILESISNHFSKNDKSDPIYMSIEEVEVDKEDDVSTQLTTKIYSLHNQNQVIETTGQEYSIIQDALKQGLHWKIIDFDAHFENVGLDFSNKNLND